MVGYRNAVYNPKEEAVELFTWSEDGDRITTSIKFRPYIYLEDIKGTSTSIFNTKLKKKVFNTYWDKTKFLKESGIRRVFENFNPVQQCLLDLYWEHNETEEFGRFPLKIYFLDIEVAVKNEFPHADRAEYPIDVITIYNSFDQKFYIWGMNPYQVTQPNVVYKHCTTEKELLYDIIEFISVDSPDIISGWNSAFFDLPYIINRINNVLGENAANGLSPCGRVYFRTFMGKFGTQQTQWYIDGISCVDYLDIYSRFIFKNQESYKLNHIAEIELGEKKVDFGNMDLFTLKETDWQKFVDYNIQDVNILARLETKLQYIPLLRMLAYVGCTTFEAAMGTLSVITGATAIRARKRGQRIITVIRNDIDKEKVPGAHVAPPLQGFQESIVSFDANSLYPNLMISLNMSPETKVGKIIDKTDEHITIKHVNGQHVKLTNQNFVKFIKENDISITKAKVLFSQKNKGVLPDLVDYYYKERVKTKKEMKKCKRELEEINKQIKELEGK